MKQEAPTSVSRSSSLEKLEDGYLGRNDNEIEDIDKWCSHNYEVISRNALGSLFAVKQCIQDGDMAEYISKSENDLVSVLMLEGITKDYVDYVIEKMVMVGQAKAVEKVNCIRKAIALGVDKEEIKEIFEISKEFIEDLIELEQ